MKNLFKFVTVIMLSFISLQLQASDSDTVQPKEQKFISEMKAITLSDGEEIIARLCLPKEKEVSTIVVSVPGTGPSTYLMKRTGFNYYDVFAEGFCEQGVGFFSYNRRGVTVGKEKPSYDKINKEKYAKYLPLTEAEDIESMITHLKNDVRFENCKIILYGASEGTEIVPLVAERGKVKVDALFLHGYAHDNLFDIIKWQNSGVGFMILMNSIFDKNDDKVIDREEYESDSKNATKYRVFAFENADFDSLDVTKDNVLDVKDFEKEYKELHDTLLIKLAENDGKWIWNNYVRVTVDWHRAHFALEPNKTRLLRIDIPIYIFHGTEDANVPVENVYDLELRFKCCNKSNLKTFIFEKHNHDLNFQKWITSKEYSEGLQKLFSMAAEV